MPTRFLHTADWQLGKPYERIDNDDDKRSLASQARFDVLNTIGERIKAHRAEFVLVAGTFSTPSSHLTPTYRKPLSAWGAGTSPSSSSRETMTTAVPAASGKTTTSSRSKGS